MNGMLEYSNEYGSQKLMQEYNEIRRESLKPNLLPRDSKRKTTDIIINYSIYIKTKLY